MPETLHDRDFCGIETEAKETCGHNEPLVRYVAFEGVNTGRRFLGCSKSVSFSACFVVVFINVQVIRIIQLNASCYLIFSFSVPICKLLFEICRGLKIVVQCIGLIWNGLHI